MAAPAAAAAAAAGSSSSGVSPVSPNTQQRTKVARGSVVSAIAAGVVAAQFSALAAEQDDTPPSPRTAGLIRKLRDDEAAVRAAAARDEVMEDGTRAPRPSAVVAAAGSGGVDQKALQTALDAAVKDGKLEIRAPEAT